MVVRSYFRGMALAASFVLFAFILSACGGRKQPSVVSPQSSDWTTGVSPVISPPPPSTAPAETTLSEALAELDALPVPDGVDASVFAELKDALANQLRTLNAERGTSKLVATPPIGPKNKVEDLVATKQGNVYVITWHYRNCGDYNQDSIVNIADLTPLAVHFNEPADESNEWIDGNADTVIDIKDITSIAANFMVSVDHYDIDGSDLEFGAFHNVAASSFPGGSAPPERRPFTYNLGASPAYNFWRVRPVDPHGDPGEVSNVASLPAPAVNIVSVEPLEGLAGTGVTFTANVEGQAPFNFNWDFGGGTTPNEVSDSGSEVTAEVTLGTAGTYDASVYVQNAEGHDSFEFTLTVNAQGGNPPNISDVSPKSGATGSDATFTADVTGDAPLNYAWSFGDGATPSESGEVSPTVTLGDPGEYPASLTVTNFSGEDLFEFTLTVNPAGGNPPDITDVNPKSGVTSTVVAFTADVSGDTPFTYAWDFGGGATPNNPTEESPSVTLGAAETYDASLTVTNDYGDDLFEFTLTVNPSGGEPPTINDVDPQSGITGTECDFTADVDGDTPFTYAWDFGGGATPNNPTDASPTVTLGAVENYDASLTVTNAYGNDSFDFTLRVSPVPSTDWTRYVADPGGIASIRLSLASVGGKPAISYGAGGMMTGVLKFATNSAADGSGTWTVYDVDSGVMIGTVNSVAEVAGKPAISYWDPVVAKVKFAINSEADGSGIWSTQTLPGSDDMGALNFIAEVDGRPAILFSNDTTHDLQFAINANADGSGAWSINTIEAVGLGGDEGSLAVVNGKPAAAYTHGTAHEVKFAINANADGSGAWTTYTVDPSGGQHPSLQVIGGFPGVAYNPSGQLKFAINSAADGSGTWSVYDVTSTSASGLERSFSLAEVDGKPAIASYQSSTRCLIYAECATADGSGAWSITVVDSPAPVGGLAYLAVIGTSPGIAYRGSGPTTSEVRFAIRNP